MPGEDRVDFERITKVYREESGKKTLVNLEPEFYDTANKYIGRLEQEAAKAAGESPTSQKTQFLQDELRKARKRIEQIYQYRERKIALLAQSKVSGVEVEMKGLTAQEVLLFDKLVGALSEVRKSVFEAGTIQGGAAPPTPAEGGKGEAVAGGEPSRPAQPQRKTVTVYVTEDLPPFAGIDVTYKLKKEDIVCLPEEYGNVLVKRGKARYVDVH